MRMISTVTIMDFIRARLKVCGGHMSLCPYPCASAGGPLMCVPFAPASTPTVRPWAVSMDAPSS